MDKYAELLAEIQPQIIETEEEYQRITDIVESMISEVDRGAARDLMLALLIVLIESFDRKYYQDLTLSPNALLLELMAENDLRQKDLVGILGSRGIVSEVVRGNRRISNRQAKALGKFFCLDPSLFVDLSDD